MISAHATAIRQLPAGDPRDPMSPNMGWFRQPSTLRAKLDEIFVANQAAIPSSQKTPFMVAVTMNIGISRTLRAVYSSFEERIIKWENTQPLREPSLSKRILPLIPAGLVINQILPSADEISMMASSCQEAPHCPSCAQASQRIHSH